MDAERLKKEESLIRRSINRIYDKSNENAAPIYDGVVDVNKYLDSDYKICWILKEPYDEGNNEGGGFNLMKGWSFDSDDGLYLWIKKIPTWKKVTYITYSILHNFIPYSKLNYIDDKPEMVNVLQEIAVININKMPAKSISNNADIARKYENWKRVLLRQINSYSPQILIFGNTFQYFRNDLGISEQAEKHIDNLDYVVQNKKLYIHAYHPSQWATVPEDEYCQGIIDVVKKNIKKLV